MRKRLLASTLMVLSWAGCATLPAPRYTQFTLPKEGVYLNNTDRPYKTMGFVRTKVNFPTLDPEREESQLCRNYYNKAVRDLLARARKVGADAIVDVKSVVFFEDGSHEFYKTPECADDGQEGQILAQAIAIKWTGPEPQGQDSRENTAIEKPKRKRVKAPQNLPEPAPTPEVPLLEENSGAPKNSPFYSPLH